MVGPTLSLYGEAHMLSCVCKSARARVYVRFVHVAYVYIIYYNRPTILLTQKIFVSPHAVKIIRSNFFHNSRFRCYFFNLIFFKYEINKSPKCTPFGRKCSKSRRLRRSLRLPSRKGLLAFGNRSFAPSALAISRIRAGDCFHHSGGDRRHWL